MVDKKTGLKTKKVAPKKLKTVKKEKVKAEPKTVDKIAVTEVAKPETKPTAKTKVSPALPLAKAGKRSAKAIAEAEAELSRQERIKSGEALSDKPSGAKKPPRSRAERAGKKYRQAAKLIDKNKAYTVAEALELAVKTSSVKFDATVELHVNLGVDPKIADQNVRDSVTLPAGTGKTLRIAVFAEGDEIVRAKTAGADIAGDSELLAQLDKEDINFDVLITSPQLMSRLGKYAKSLGPKGLMPNPKSGTITTDIVGAIKEARAGRVEYRVDGAGIIHLGIGKVSFGAEKLRQNADTVLSSIRAAKPSSLKGLYINSAFITTTMGPSIRISL